MATWITHLRIAERLHEGIGDLDAGQFGIGSIAPDSGIPDEKWENFDPPTEITHFQSPQKQRRNCQDLEFYRKYLKGEAWSSNHKERNSYYLGYFFHLIVDNLWSKNISRPTKELFEHQYSEDFENKREFFGEMKRDWYGLDFVYLHNHPTSFFWNVFIDSEVTSTYLDFLPLEALKQRVEYIKTFYQRKDEAIDNLFSRPFKYLSSERVNGFVEEVSQTMLQVYQLIWVEDMEVGECENALELL